MSEPKVDAVVHAENIGSEERTRFRRKMTPEQLREILLNGGDGVKILISMKEDPDKNVVMEYKRKSENQE